jgi:hypothetical protein
MATGTDGAIAGGSFRALLTRHHACVRPHFTSSRCGRTLPRLLFVICPRLAGAWVQWRYARHFVVAICEAGHLRWRRFHAAAWFRATLSFRAREGVFGDVQQLDGGIRRARDRELGVAVSGYCRCRKGSCSNACFTPEGQELARSPGACQASAGLPPLAGQQCCRVVVPALLRQAASLISASFLGLVFRHASSGSTWQEARGCGPRVARPDRCHWPRAELSGA